MQISLVPCNCLPCIPCSPATWASMLERGRLVHKADITTDSRKRVGSVDPGPVATAADKLAVHLTKALRHAVA
jgi:hypothetical protein